MSRRLHVIMPTDVFPPVCGGAGWSAHALAQALQARGHRVTAVVPRAVERGTGGRLEPLAPVEVLGVPAAVVPYSAPRLPLVANWYRHEWLWPLVRNVIVREALRDPDERPIIIHAQHVQTAPAAVLAGRELGAPAVVTVRDHWPRDYFATGLHGDRLPFPANTVASLATDLPARLGPLRGALASVAIPYMLRHLRCRQAFLRQADAVIAVSRYIAAGLPPDVSCERVHVIPNLVDVAAVERIVAEPLASPLPERFVLFAGKLERNKGAHLLAEVMATVREQRPGAEAPDLVVAGNGALREELRHCFAERGLGLHILPGWTAHDEVLRLMRRAEVLVFPSAWGEPLTRVLLEASAAGACIAAMPTGGTPEIVVDGVSGVLAASPAALGRAVAALLDDPARCARLRRGALGVARQRFAPVVVAGRYEAVYEALWTRRGATG